MDLNEIWKKHYENSKTNYALFDKNFKLIKSRIKSIVEDISQENISVFDGEFMSFDINSDCEKKCVVQTGNKLSPVVFRTLYNYTDNSPIGYEAREIELSELFSGKYVPKKTSSSARIVLSTITANSDMLGVLLDENDLYEGFDYLKPMQTSCVRVLSAVSNSEMIYKLFENGQHVKADNVSLIVKNIVETAQFDFGEKIKINYDIEDNLYAEIDKEFLICAVMNLLTNAYIYNLSEKKICDISLSLKNNNICLTLSDNGVGIENSLKNSKDFSAIKEGLGLSFVRLFAKTNGGSFRIVSKGDNDGTNVQLVFPGYYNKTTASVRFPNLRENRFSLYNVLLEKAKIKE